MGAELGPLDGLVGIWEGEKGHDESPDDDRAGTEVNKFREQIRFEDLGLVENHEQKLYGLRYATTAWRLGASDPFHEELGYWLWDAAEGQVLRCFMVPRGVTVIAGGSATADSTSFDLSAELGSATYGICSNRFLDREFKTVAYTLHFEKRGDEIHYREDTVMEMPGRSEPFHHTDENTLRRVG